MISSIGPGSSRCSQVTVIVTKIIRNEVPRPPYLGKKNLSRVLLTKSLLLAVDIRQSNYRTGPADRASPVCFGEVGDSTHLSAVSSASSVTVDGLSISWDGSMCAPYTRLYSFKLTSRPSSLSMRESSAASYFKSL